MASLAGAAGSGMRHAAAWTAGRVAAVAARLSYAMVEGFAFAFSRPSAALVVAAELAAFAWLAGVRVPLRVAAGTVLAAGTLRSWQCLFRSFRDSGLHPHGIEELSSIWEWEPPAADAGASSTWHILRQLAVTANTVKENNPAISSLLNQPELAANELAMRLYYYYLAEDEPLLNADQVASLDAAHASSSAVDKQGDSWAAPVPDSLKRQLNHYRDLACLAYDYSTDETLGEQLTRRGFTLLCASYDADLASGCPAYFLCISEEEREVALVIRGTFSPEDAFVDLLANGAPFDANGHCHGADGCAVEPAAEGERGPARPLTGLCHCGMGKAALFLGAKFAPLLRPLHDQGMRVTLVGHSLGAGVASLLALFLHNRGLGADRLHCWAYETPACMDRCLAQACSGIVTSLVNGDDCVPRACMRSFAGLLEELASFDWQAEAERHARLADGSEGSGVAAHLSKLLLFAFGSMGSNGSGKAGAGGKESGKSKADPGSSSSRGDGNSAGEQADTAEAADEALHVAAAAADEAGMQRLGSDGFEQGYNAHVPGRVCLVFRSGPGKGEHTADGESAAPASRLALVPCTHNAVRRLRVSSTMITDHFVDYPEVVAALT